MMVEVFLDQQSLGLRKYLKAVGITVHDDSEIRGSKDTSKGVPDERVLEFLRARPDLVMVTKDKHYKKAKGIKLVFVDESEAVAIEALRQLTSKKF